MNSEPDAKIIKLFQAGDREKFGLLYDKYIRKIYDFIYYKTHHKQTAEDLVSQTFLAALEHLAGFNPNQGTFQAWLYCIARNKVIDYYRGYRPEAELADCWDLASQADPEQELDTRQRLDQVKNYLAALTVEQREIIIWRLWQGLSFKEIAELSGKTEAAAKMILARILKKLRQDLPLASLMLLFFYN